MIGVAKYQAWRTTADQMPRVAEERVRHGQDQPQPEREGREQERHDRQHRPSAGENRVPSIQTRK